MEDWVVAVIIAIANIVAVFMYVKFQSNQNTKDITDNKSNLIKIWEKIDEINKKVSEHHIQIKQVPTMIEVETKFVQIEFYLF